MCVDPVTATLVLTAASAAVSAVGSIQAGQAQQSASNYNAAMLERNAEFARNDQVTVQDQAAIDRRRRGIEAQAKLGEIRAKGAAMGLNTDFGSFADLQDAEHNAYNIDRGIIGQNEKTNLEALDRQIAGYQGEAKLQRMTGKQAVTASYFNAAGDLLKGGASVADHWIMPSTGAATRAATTWNPSPELILPTG